MLKKNSWTVNIWKEGRYIDIWHVNHFTAGLLMGGIPVFLPFSLWFGFLISLIGMLAWEYSEVVRDLYEFPINKTLDVVTGVVGFFLMYRVYVWVGHPLDLSIFYILFLIFIIIEIWGFKARAVLIESGYDPRKFNSR